MAQSFIGESVAAGNAAYATIFTMPADAVGFLGNITASNTTGGALTITLSKEVGGTTFILSSADAIAANATNSYSGGSTRRITPVVLKSGEIFKAQGSGAGIIVTISGLQFS